jgi:isoleucyl-tRNA synthetase
LPGQREASVHLSEFPRTNEIEKWRDPELEAEWQQLLDLRGIVNAALEGARQRKEIGNALSAHVAIAAEGGLADLLRKYNADLPMLFITSDVRVEPGSAGAPVVTVTAATGEKCPRCWRYVPGLVTQGPATGACHRCSDAIGGTSGHAN